MASSFPISGDEDVEILLTSDDQDDTFQLHSYVLALHSRWFKASISERWNGTKSTTDGGKDRWVYVLRFDKDDAFGLLARQEKATESENTTTEMITRKLPADASAAVKKLHKQRLPRVNAHKRVFEAMYHITPTFETSFQEARTSMLQVTEVAEAYECQQVAKIHVVNHLNFSRNDVLDSCASDPLQMLELASAVKAEWLFTEASIAILGLWRGAFAKCEPGLRAMGCWDLFQEKRAHFREKLMACERRLFEMQPAYCYKATAEMKGSGQLAIDFFRQWLSEQLSNDGGSHMKAGYAALYRDISRRQRKSDTTPDEMQQVTSFLTKCHSTLEESQVSKEVYKTFGMAASVLAPILKNKSMQQDNEGHSHRDLTFMTINASKIPWAQKK
ncbi:hypothetical protein M409DRAFT_16963 [Zasmidium cellare ATCC 36951]|uniref:BTB domain-containing protein n=1 Tax=Zasmidium cellare ATCC 36951 TaxID=1080233 RepID=A0A6A6D1S4_ZASCE|nr:uncharacterized protein M409DRAFT_16963 [Zasmidium cellare ATCC 36951]KAF2173013.1 hypothetical protein M409DRAFT_16963 [Zasmidium cellare ATCC 36951]